MEYSRIGGNPLKSLFRTSAAVLTLLHLARIFLPMAVELPMFVAAAAVLASGLPLMGSGFRKAAIAFLALGIILLAASRAGIADWIAAWNSMTNTVAIMVALQVFSIPVSMSACDELVRRWAERSFRSPRPLFLFSMSIVHVLTSFLMMGSIPLSMSLLERTLKTRVPDYRRFISTAVSRGYVLSALWAPGAINLYLVVQATGVAWSAILLPGFVLAIMSLFLSYLMESLRGGVIAASASEPAPASTRETSPDGARPGGGAGQVLAAALSIVALVLLLERLGIGSGYQRIMLSGPVVAAAWTLLLRNARAFREAAAGYWRDGIMKVVDIGPFFVAMGVFSGALDASGLLDRARPALQEAASWLGSSAVAILPLAVIALSLVGLHPFVTIVLFGKILSGSGLALPPLTIALSLAVGGAAAYMISPFAGIIMSISRYTGAKASDVAVRWNWKFGLAFYAMGVLFAFAWGVFLGPGS